MKQPDWSTAPEGATHYHPKLANPWLKDHDEADDDIPMHFSCGQWAPYGTPSAGRLHIADAIPRPASPTWDGQGLPPIGITCEYMNGSGHWHQVRITGHGELGLCFRVPGRDGENYVHRDCHFRPLRTPEQIAAEQRAEAIGRMCRDIERAPQIVQANSTLEISVAMRTVAEALHDAGYRKTPIGLNREMLATLEMVEESLRKEGVTGALNSVLNGVQRTLAKAEG